ncbi:MAG: biotin transporter BioY [Armatimonadota bacterium]|nr:biotin transporter BioY [Armatimonadota bacterium]MCX7778155.1 biotin transporter BioY [Armatimonadota bacterium]MDW8024509.1 biotin transporter BioY [Armatimonadota bacterium]
MRKLTLADVCVAALPIALPFFSELSLILLGSISLIVLSQVRIPLPFTPVPITLQTLGVLLIGLSFGSLRGSVTAAVYIVFGAIGVPAFAGGACGWKHLFGPTGGYLFGFVAAAWLVGRLAELRWDRSFWLTFASTMLGTLVIYVFGVAWLSCFVGIERSLTMGVLPFIPGDIIKALVAAAVLPSVWRLIGTRCGIKNE